MICIPAIDILDGKCVRLTRGEFGSRTVYSSDPVEMALRFEAAGVTHLHLIDLDGARSGRMVNRGILQKIATATDMHIEFGGGIQSEADIQAVLDSGAAMVVIGSQAVQQPELFTGWLSKYGPERIILAADFRQSNIVINGWKTGSGFSTEEFIDYYLDKGIRRVLCTDVERDGALTGPAFEMYRSIVKTFPSLYLIASGGIRSLKDLIELKKTGLAAAVVGKAIYENRIELKDLEKFSADKTNNSLP